jgi:hypothetical protein
MISLDFRERFGAFIPASKIPFTERRGFASVILIQHVYL